MKRVLAMAILLCRGTGCSQVHRYEYGTYLTRADAEERQGDHDAAIADCTRAIEAEPDFARAWACRAQSEAKKGDDPSARLDLDKAIQLAPTDGGAYCNRAAVRYRQHDLSGALDDANQAV